MQFNVTFEESTSEMAADFGLVTEIKNGYTQDQVDKLVADAAAEGVEQGKKAEYDAFWDSMQQNGGRRDYSRAFAGAGWTRESFRPKYNLTGYRFDHCFSYNRSMNCDLVELLNERNVSLDTSGSTFFNNMFDYSTFTRVGELDVSGGTSFYSFIANSDIRTIEKLILGDGNQDLYYLLQGSSKLVNVVIEGIIGSDLNCKESILLSKASITSIVNALSVTTTDSTVTFSLTAVNNAFETSAGAADGSASEEWLALAATKSNWTISLV